MGEICFPTGLYTVRDTRDSVAYTDNRFYMKSDWDKSKVRINKFRINVYSRKAGQKVNLLNSLYVRHNEIVIDSFFEFFELRKLYVT